MDLWQMDVMGWVFLAGGAEVKIVTGIDDHSLSQHPGQCRLAGHHPDPEAPAGKATTDRRLAFRCPGGPARSAASWTESLSPESSPSITGEILHLDGAPNCQIAGH
jgi:hypothetical protein